MSEMKLFFESGAALLMKWCGLNCLWVGYRRLQAAGNQPKEETSPHHWINEAERKSGANKPINLSLLSSLFWIMKWN